MPPSRPKHVCHAPSALQFQPKLDGLDANLNHDAQAVRRIGGGAVEAARRGLGLGQGRRSGGGLSTTVQNDGNW